MKQTLGGLKHTGSWTEVVHHGDNISEILHSAELCSAASLQEWDEWRPKIYEALNDEVTKKTAEKASINKGSGEENGRNPKNDMKKAGKKLVDVPKDAVKKPKEATKGIQHSAKYAARAADAVSRKMLRKVEKTVYEKVMTQVSPCYFDNECISANIQKKTQLSSDRNVFVFEVIVHDDDARNTLFDEVAGIDDDEWLE